ncbi:MAG TPA: GNAT family N-acetyltransferase [Acidimicrobiales bacterium]|nr:GNAT family N-acetyltransferase [Acidimicrobiales bacterium]
MTEGARPARRDDLPRLAELAEEAVAGLEARRGGRQLTAGFGDPARSMAALLDDDGTSVWVGTVDDVVVGVGTALAPGDGSVGRIELLYVEPDARQVGVGEAILDGLLGWLADRGCEGADAFALPGDRDSKQFFEGAGMVARLLVMHRPLRRGADGGGDVG